MRRSLRAARVAQLLLLGTAPAPLPRLAPLAMTSSWGAARPTDEASSSPSLLCEARFSSSVNTTGLVSVVPFLGLGLDDATAVGAAINMSSACEAGVRHPCPCPEETGELGRQTLLNLSRALGLTLVVRAQGVWIPNSGHGAAGPPHGGALQRVGRAEELRVLRRVPPVPFFFFLFFLSFFSTRT